MRLPCLKSLGVWPDIVEASGTEDASLTRRMRAMVMAAGLGTRLRPLTYDVPKPMVPVANRPVMELILRTLATAPNHGFAIARRIQQISKSVLRVEQGSLYPALHRMELDGLIESYWSVTENNRKAKYYRLTRRGTRALASETQRWNAIAGAIAAILQEG